MVEPIVWQFKRGEGSMATCKVGERRGGSHRQQTGPTFRMGKPKETVRTQPTTVVPAVTKPVAKSVVQPEKKRTATRMENANAEVMDIENGELPALPTQDVSAGSGVTFFC